MGCKAVFRKVRSCIIKELEKIKKCLKDVQLNKVTLSQFLCIYYEISTNVSDEAAVLMLAFAAASHIYEGDKKSRWISTDTEISRVT